MIRTATLCALLAGAVVGAAAAPADGEWKVVAYINPELAFNAREVPLHPAPGGFALTVVDGLWHLVPATLSAKVTSTDPKGRPDMVAISATPAEALAYLRLPSLSAGKVDTPDMRFKGVERDLGKGTVAVPFKGGAWRFEARAGAAWLTDGSVRQKIADTPPPANDDDPHSVSLLWAGDLDRDGRLDFLVAETGDDGATMCVWLSGRAATGQLAGKAGCMDRAF
jgi:hypothetical protein